MPRYQGSDFAAFLAAVGWIIAALGVVSAIYGLISAIGGGRSTYASAEVVASSAFYLANGLWGLAGGVLLAGVARIVEATEQTAFFSAHTAQEAWTVRYNREREEEKAKGRR